MGGAHELLVEGNTYPGPDSRLIFTILHGVPDVLDND